MKTKGPIFSRLVKTNETSLLSSDHCSLCCTHKQLPVSSHSRVQHWRIYPECHIYASVNWVSFGSDNGLSPNRHQAIILTNAGLLSIGPLGRSFNEILIKIQNFSFTKMHLKMSSAKWRPFCPGRDEFSVLHSQAVACQLSLKSVALSMLHSQAVACLSSCVSLC